MTDNAAKKFVLVFWVDDKTTSIVDNSALEDQNAIEGAETLVTYKDGNKKATANVCVEHRLSTWNMFAMLKW